MATGKDGINRFTKVEYIYILLPSTVSVIYGAALVARFDKDVATELAQFFVREPALPERSSYCSFGLQYTPIDAPLAFQLDVWVARLQARPLDVVIRSEPTSRPFRER